MEQRKEYMKQLSQTKRSSEELKNKIENKDIAKNLKNSLQKGRVWAAKDLLKRPEFSYKTLEVLGLSKKTQRDVAEPVEIEIKYEGYIQIQNQMIKKNLKMGQLSLKNVNYRKVHGLSSEAREKLEEVQPLNLEQAQRISGVTPASLQALIIHAQKTLSSHSKKINSCKNAGP